MGYNINYKPLTLLPDPIVYRQLISPAKRGDIGSTNVPRTLRLPPGRFEMCTRVFICRARAFRCDSEVPGFYLLFNKCIERWVIYNVSCVFVDPHRNCKVMHAAVHSHSRQCQDSTG